MDDIAIKVSGVSKSFRLPHERYSGLKQAIIGFFSRNKKRGYEKQHALKDISFEVKKGEFFGIVGRNGSGKSTLLKIVSGIYQPDKGSVQVNGSLTPFIELGVGFNPELTGRENVFLNGALFGFSHKEMEAMYDEIVEFAELEKFMDQKLKNYSSGMQVRLAFSIAIRSNSDILVLDEVLAVGDEAFQRKCNEYFDKIKKEKTKTIVLVTHGMDSVRKYCDRAMLVSNGVVEDISDTDIISEKYSKLNAPPQIITDYKNKVNEIRVKYKNSYKVGDKMDIKVDWQDNDTTTVSIVLFKSSGERIFATSTKADGFEIANEKSIEHSLKLDVGPGEYFLRLRTYTDDPKSDTGLVNTGLIEQSPFFTVKPGDISIDGLVNLEHEWR